MQELAAAEDAKKVIDTLSVTSDSPNTLETLHHIYDQARRANSPIISSTDAVNAAARNKALLALNDIIGSLQARSLTPAKIDRGKVALDAWIKLLKGQSEASSTLQVCPAPQASSQATEFRFQRDSLRESHCERLRVLPHHAPEISLANGSHRQEMAPRESVFAESKEDGLPEFKHTTL